MTASNRSGVFCALPRLAFAGLPVGGDCRRLAKMIIVMEMESSTASTGEASVLIGQWRARSQTLDEVTIRITSAKRAQGSQADQMDQRDQRDQGDQTDGGPEKGEARREGAGRKEGRKKAVSECSKREPGNQGTLWAVSVSVSVSVPKSGAGQAARTKPFYHIVLQSACW